MEFGVIIVMLHRANNLPVDLNATIFCNFNKIDKIEPVTFATWMNVRNYTIIEIRFLYIYIANV